MSLPRRTACTALVVLAMGGAAAHAGDAAAEAPIAAFNAGLIAAMKAGASTPFLARYQALAVIVDRAFDVPAILKASVGLAWNTVLPEQKAALLSVFRSFTITSYIANFNSYGGETLDILPDQRAVGDAVVVATRLTPRSGDPVRLDYVMRRDGDAWRVVDVLLDGSISRVAVQRSDFRGVLAHGGAPALISSLQRKVAALSGGAAPS